MGRTRVSAAFDFDFLPFTVKVKINFKGGGQECPPHTTCYHAATMKLTYPFLVVMLTCCASAQTSPLGAEVETVYPDAHAFYVDLHQNPELSSHETQTAQKLAGRLRDLGYSVTEHVGGTGVVAVLKNGAGTTVMLRTELDALPVEEKTGLPYASKVHAKDDSGRDVAVMHACGHDLHMAALVATAAIMAHSKSSWHGTLILIGQPAEETISGAKRMIEDGLMTRFPKPDVAVAMHVGNQLPAGQVGVGPGYRFSNADSLRITIYGKGGHGSMPNSTIDPVVIAARRRDDSADHRFPRSEAGRSGRHHRRIHSGRHEKQHHPRPRRTRSHGAQLQT